MLLCIEIMIVCQKYNVHIKNNQIIIILTPMVINTHSDSTSADILSFIRDIHCLSGSVWLLTSDYIQITRFSVSWIIVIFSCVGCVLGPGLLMMELEFCLDRGFPGLRDAGHGRHQERDGQTPGPDTWREKDYYITMDQFSSIISNLNLLSKLIFVNIFICVKTKKISIHSQITNWAQNA